MYQQTRLLVVDDNPTNIEILREMLDDKFLIYSASSGLEAIHMIETTSVNVLLLDVVMPGIDGHTLCRYLRSRAGGDELLIIMVTAKAMPAERKIGLEAGANAYLAKPFTEEDLLAVINSWL